MKCSRQQRRECSPLQLVETPPVGPRDLQEAVSLDSELILTGPRLILNSNAATEEGSVCSVIHISCHHVHVENPPLQTCKDDAMECDQNAHLMSSEDAYIHMVSFV